MTSLTTVDSLLDLSPSAGLDRYINLVGRVGGDAAYTRSIAEATMRYLHLPAPQRRVADRPDRLQERWYAALADGRIAWDVYDDPAYLAELWACWAMYSRSYLRAVRQAGILDFLAPVRRIADIGCGFGFTCAALATMAPQADVVGFDLPTSPQYRMAALLAESFNYRMTGDLADVGAPVDLVFASEYFEHFIEPVCEVRRLLDALHPRALLIAHTFTQAATGHFPMYQVGEMMVDGRRTGRAFAEALRRAGYQRVTSLPDGRPLPFWNGRPTFWLRAPRGAAR